MPDKYIVYVLYSPDFNKIYIGYTADIKRRLNEHNDPQNKGYTKRYQPWKILFTEMFETRSAAMKREKQLKTARAREHIWSVVKKQYEKIL